MTRTEINAAIADAFEKLAKRWPNAESIFLDVAAELRAAGCPICAPNRCNTLHSLGEITSSKAAEPASEQDEHRSAYFAALDHAKREPTYAEAFTALLPPPSLVERLRKCIENPKSGGDYSLTNNLTIRQVRLLTDVADALEAAQAESDKLRAMLHEAQADSRRLARIEAAAREVVDKRDPTLTYYGHGYLWVAIDALAVTMERKP